MKRLRWWVVALIVGLVVFYNLEQVILSEENLLDIQTLSYVLVLMAVVSTIALLPLGKLPGWAVGLGWLVVYGLSALLLSDGKRSQMGSAYLYLLIAEAAMFYMLVWLASQVSGALQEFAAAVEQVTVPDVERWVISMQDAKAKGAIQTEINRSLRYERPLSIVCIRPNFDTVQFVLQRIFAEVQESIAHHVAIANLGRMLKLSLRRTDLITLEDRSEGLCIVLCPETDISAASVLAQRIATTSDQELGFSVIWGSAAFPDDAPTFDEVVALAVAGQGCDDLSGVRPVEEKSV